MRGLVSPNATAAVPFFSSVPPSFNRSSTLLFLFLPVVPALPPSPRSPSSSLSTAERFPVVHLNFIGIPRPVSAILLRFSRRPAIPFEFPGTAANERAVLSLRNYRDSSSAMADRSRAPLRAPDYQLKSAVSGAPVTALLRNFDAINFGQPFPPFAYKRLFVAAAKKTPATI